MRSPTALLLALAMLAGCTQPTQHVVGGRTGVGPAVQAPSLSPGATPTPTGNAATLAPGPGVPATPTPATTAPAPTVTVLPALVVPAPGERSTVDRPDETQGLALHVLYYLPADATDEHLDTDGTITRSVEAANRWLATQTGGPKLRLDTYQGQLDLTFYRGKATQAQLGVTSDARAKAMADELQAAGFLDPLKVYAAYGGGGSAIEGSTIELGIGGGGFANVFIKQCGNCTLASNVDKPSSYEFCLIHETLHALGFVPACAPHVTPDDHTNDNPKDLMAAVADGDTPILDPGHDDYYKANIGGCPDFARSPFLDPVPDNAELPGDRPLVSAAPAGAVAFAPKITLATTPGEASTEDPLFAALNQARKDAGKPVLALDDRLRAVARQPITADRDKLDALLGAAGYAGPGGFAAADFPGGVASAAQLFATTDTFKSLVTVEATAAGLGVVKTAGGGARVSVIYGTPALQVVSASVAAGPLGTSTVAITVKAATGTVHGRVFVDDKPYLTPFMADAATPVTVVASVAAGGKHTVGLGVADANDAQRYAIDEVFTLDNGVLGYR